MCLPHQEEDILRDADIFYLSNLAEAIMIVHCPSKEEREPSGSTISFTPLDVSQV
jgi:hypothetical protein